MPSEPIPPDSIPKYIHEPIKKQDVETLEDIIKYAEELIDYRNQPPEEVEADEGEMIEEVDQGSTKTKVTKKVPCGKDACSNCPHGPYLYFCWREGDKIVWEYEGPVEA